MSLTRELGWLRRASSFRLLRAAAPSRSVSESAPPRRDQRTRVAFGVALLSRFGAPPLGRCRDLWPVASAGVVAGYNGQRKRTTEGFRLWLAAAPSGRCRRALLRAATNAHASLSESLSSRASWRRRLAVTVTLGPRHRLVWSLATTETNNENGRRRRTTEGFRLLLAAAPSGRCREASLRGAINGHAPPSRSLPSRASGRRRLAPAVTSGPRHRLVWSLCNNGNGRRKRRRTTEANERRLSAAAGGRQRR